MGCRICYSKNCESLYEQKFAITGLKKLVKYTVTVCNSCGFLFADNIPSQREYDNYYKSTAKYSYDISEENIPEGLKNIHKLSFSKINSLLIRKYPEKNRANIKILDIGCSTGYLLNLFKKSGYKDMTGIEPSHACREIGKKLYGIDIHQCILSDFQTDKNYDLIILSGVLEHIMDLHGLFEKISSLISRRGILYIVVPDAGNFSINPEEPFHEFSIEHINYFTKKSLQNISEKYQFIKEDIESLKTEFYDSNYLSCIFIKSDYAIEPEKDNFGIKQLKEYIKKSNVKLSSLRKFVDSLVEEQEKIIIWGCGAYTSRVISTTNLLNANIDSFIDSNVSLHNDKLANIDIKPPEYIKGKKTAVLIMSHVYKNEIKKILKEKFDYKGKIITL